MSKTRQRRDRYDQPASRKARKRRQIEARRERHQTAKQMREVTDR